MTRMNDGVQCPKCNKYHSLGDDELDNHLDANDDKFCCYWCGHIFDPFAVPSEAATHSDSVDDVKILRQGE